MKNKSLLADFDKSIQAPRDRRAEGEEVLVTIERKKEHKWRKPGTSYTINIYRNPRVDNTCRQSGPALGGMEMSRVGKGPEVNCCG